MVTQGQPGGLLDWAVANEPMDGEEVCGDCAVVREFDGYALAAAVDGVGHGVEAAKVAGIATGVLEEFRGPIIPLFQQCHEQLRNTRGVVLSVASFNGDHHTMTWMGVGNIQGVLLRAQPEIGRPNENLLVFGGLLGYQMPPLRALTVPVVRGDLLVLATDGVAGEFADHVPAQQAPGAIAERLLLQYRRGNDDSLVLVARYMGKTD